MAVTRLECLDCGQWVFEVNCPYLDGEFGCNRCGAINIFQKSSTPTSFRLPQPQAHPQPTHT